MGNFWKRVSKRIQMTRDSYRSDRQFSIRYANLRITDELGGRLGFSKASQQAHKKRESFILDYLHTLLEPVFTEFREDTEPGVQEEKAPIWIFWWTGFETAPPLVKKCVESTCAHGGEHPVHLLDRNNIGDYVTIPDYMQEKLRTKKMGLAHLADYIRVSLLSQYGGLWLDATIFCADTVPESYFAMPIFTCKSLPDHCPYLSQMRWTTFVFGGWKNNVFYRYLKAAFEQYWSRANTAIDYLFFDYIIELGCREIPAIREQLEAVPMNNPHRDDLQAAMNRADPAENWNEILQPDTVLYKLSWRETYAEKTADGKDSVYAYLLK